MRSECFGERESSSSIYIALDILAEDETELQATFKVGWGKMKTASVLRRLNKKGRREIEQSCLGSGNSF